MNTFLSKLKSRKFWAAIIGILTGVSMIFGLDQNIINTIAGAVVALGSLGVYIVTEGRNDYAGIVAKTQENLTPIKEGIETVKEIVTEEDEA